MHHFKAYLNLFIVYLTRSKAKPFKSLAGPPAVGLLTAGLALLCPSLPLLQQTGKFAVLSPALWCWCLPEGPVAPARCSTWSLSRWLGTGRVCVSRVGWHRPAGCWGTEALACAALPWGVGTGGLGSSHHGAVRAWHGGWCSRWCAMP